MKIRATISVEIEAADFIEAAEHQRRFQSVFGDVRSQYAGAELEFKECRGRPDRVGGARAPIAPPVRSGTGRLSVYENG